MSHGHCVTYQVYIQNSYFITHRQTPVCPQCTTEPGLGVCSGALLFTGVVFSASLTIAQLSNAVWGGEGWLL